MSNETIIFSMERVSKVIPPQKTIIKNIYLSFFYGAKIGVLGLNGSGKSTLLRIIAGMDKSFTGDVVWSPGYTVGMLEQEPQLDPNKTVIEVVEEAVVEIKNLLKEFDEINEAFAAVGIASMRELGISDDIVNVNGGAIALGHPIGMSGNRLALTLLHELKRRGGGMGAAALCGGGGQGDALVVRTI